MPGKLVFFLIGFTAFICGLPKTCGAARRKIFSSATNYIPAEETAQAGSGIHESGICMAQYRSYGNSSRQGTAGAIPRFHGTLPYGIRDALL